MKNCRRVTLCLFYGRFAMARRPTTPQQPQPANLTVEQMRRGVVLLNRRIGELEAFDPNSVSRRWAPEVKALEVSIDEALIQVFGHDTIEYHRYRRALPLDSGPIRVVTDSSSWIQPRGRGYGRGDDLGDARRYLTEGKERAVVLLRQAVKGLEERIADQGAEERADTAALHQVVCNATRIFVVHGHNEAVRETVARFISERLGFEPIILHERPNKGRTIIDKLRQEAGEVGFAVVLMTADDVGAARGAEHPNPRARQNVVFELGFFIGLLGPDRVAALVEEGVERPSDYDGVIYISLSAGDWRTQLGKELQEAGYTIDWNKVMRL